MEPTRVGRVANAGMKLLLPTLLVAVPVYILQWSANQLYYASNPVFYTVSGFRFDFFLSYFFFAALLVGYFVADWRIAIASTIGGVVILVVLFYWVCDPRVCYFAGLDGLEPLREGYFFAAEMVLGVVCGRWIRIKAQLSRSVSLVTGLVLILVIGYYPVAYSFAGPQQSSSLGWAEPLLIILVSLGTAAIVTENSGSLLFGISIPMLGTTLITLLLTGVGGTYVAASLVVFGLVWLLAAIGALLGGLVARYVSSLSPKTTRLGLIVTLLVVLIIGYTFTNSAVGLVIQGVPHQGQDPFEDAPIYIGGFMSGSPFATKGVSATISFAATDPSVIQSDNFLAAGIGVQSPNCCVDGLDYGYRIDAYLFHDGREIVEANAWQTCDTNVACGARPWRNLMLHAIRGVTGLGSSLWLAMKWNNRTVTWYFGANQNASESLASLQPPSQENAYFNLGEVGVTTSNMPTGSAYFFQFGIMSRYAIERAGWETTISCPAYLRNDAWQCVNHAQSLQGSASYWKVLWRWGATYPFVDVVSNSEGPSVSFFYSNSTAPSLQQLW